MTRLIIAICIAMAASLCLVAFSSAHKVNIFAYVDGNSIVTDSGYSRTKRVSKGVVEVHDAASGDLLLSGNTDADGKFSFVVPERARAEKMDLRLVLKAGEGHQAEWVVKFDEFGAGAGTDPAQAAASGSDAGKIGAADAVASSAPAAAIAPAANAADIAAVESVVRRELAPVKQMLAEMYDSGPGVTEILGGIGYIFGLFGVVAYMKSRKSA